MGPINGDRLWPFQVSLQCELPNHFHHVIGFLEACHDNKKGACCHVCAFDIEGVDTPVIQSLDNGSLDFLVGHAPKIKLGVEITLHVRVSQAHTGPGKVCRTAHQVCVDCGYGKIQHQKAPKKGSSSEMSEGEGVAQSKCGQS